MRYGGGAVRAELVAEESQLTADGRTQPLIALRVFDAAGEPARPGTLGAYRVDPPYRTWWEVETLHDNPLLVESRREPTFAVDDDGLVRILLEPTTESGAAVVRLRFNERQEQEIRAWLAPEQRDWILVGIAESTTAYADLERRARAARHRGRLHERRPARVLREGPHQGLVAADDRVRLGARPPASSRTACSARSSPTATTRCTATPSSNGSRPRRRASCT